MILLAENNMDLIKSTKEWLPFNFAMKDLGEVSFVLEV